MYVRIQFWSDVNPTPRVIARMSGKTVEDAMRKAFVPVDDPSWRQEAREGRLYVLRGHSGYCGEVVYAGPSEPQAHVPKPRVRERLGLVKPALRTRLVLGTAKPRNKL
jgi:hypothetical protein